MRKKPGKTIWLSPKTHKKMKGKKRKYETFDQYINRLMRLKK